MNWSNFKHHDIYTDWLESSDTVKDVAQRHEISPQHAGKIIAFGINERPKKVVVKAQGSKRIRSVYPYGLLGKHREGRSTV